MNCREALEQFGDLVDDDLDGWHRIRLQLHLLICRHCRRYLSSYRATIQATQGAFRAAEEPVADERLPDEQVASILKAVGSD
ncbi:MAG TPA: zf-HC2 domain-containing protein [Planctomycetaceae bacterium]